MLCQCYCICHNHITDRDITIWVSLFDIHKNHDLRLDLEKGSTVYVFDVTKTKQRQGTSCRCKVIIVSSALSSIDIITTNLTQLTTANIHQNTITHKKEN